MSGLGVSIWTILIPLIVAFAVGAALGPMVIPFLRKLKHPRGC